MTPRFLALKTVRRQVVRIYKLEKVYFRRKINLFGIYPVVIKDTSVALSAQDLGQHSKNYPIVVLSRPEL
jgi:hypothetical protein